MASLPTATEKIDRSGTPSRDIRFYWPTPSLDDYFRDGDTREWKAFAILSVWHDKDRKRFVATLDTEWRSGNVTQRLIDYGKRGGGRVAEHAVARYSPKGLRSFADRALILTAAHFEAGTEQVTSILPPDDVTPLFEVVSELTVTI